MTTPATPEKKTTRPPRTHAPETHRMLPQSKDAEMGVLGCILLLPDTVLSQCEERGMTSEWFHFPAHATIFEFCVAMRTAKMPLDFITLTQHLANSERLAECGGAAFVTELFTFLPTAASSAYYIEILAEKHAARRLIQTCTEFVSRCYEEQDRTGELIDEAQAAILAINRPDSTGTETIQHIKQGAIEAVAAIQQTYECRGGLVGLPSGFHGLDRMTGGMQGPLLVVVAGRPSMGKSAFLWNVAEHIAVTLRKPVLGFSLEMTVKELATRMVCARAKVNLQRVRDGYLSQHQVAKTLPNAVSSVAGAPIYLDETPGLSIQELRVRARRFVRAHPDTAAIFVDYLQIMKSTTRQAQGNRAMEIADISGGLKNLAKELGRPIIVGAQINRDSDGAAQKPKLSNLRESGSIEQDADWVIILHRKWYYTRDDDDKGKASVDLAKQRNGPVGDFPLVFVDELGRFENNPGEELYSNDARRRQGGDPDDE